MPLDHCISAVQRRSSSAVGQCWNVAKQHFYISVFAVVYYLVVLLCVLFLLYEYTYMMCLWERPLPFVTLSMTNLIHNSHICNSYNTPVRFVSDL